ncbi:tetratricopeptide repeat protein [Sulfurovum sp.]|uniref:tetratricopeptide repeat protein n=1 Tax=Sulfurovum sp. TaxID=1969726 RepID=UPI0025CDCF04|nr:tetratricopeptide repeat protein [Sulfurovum sp.]
MIILLGLTLCVWSGDFDQAVKDYNQGNYIKALNVFYVLAKKGDAQAQYNVGLIYANGKGVKADVSEAMQWYEKAAKQGIGTAQYNLAQLYYQKGENGEPHAYEKAKYWYEKAIKNSIKEAYNNLASLYMDAKGVAKDEKRAFELFAKAADLGDSAAQVNVAVMYAWGKEVKHDKMKAYENLKKALKSGKSEASEYLDRLCKESAWVCQD